MQFGNLFAYIVENISRNIVLEESETAAMFPYFVSLFEHLREEI